jgi:MFS family permease
MSILAGSSKDRRYLPWRSNRQGQTMTKTSSWNCIKEPCFQKIVDCQPALRDLRGGSRYRCDLGDEYADSIAVFDTGMSTVASLPFFLLTLPAGALADLIDRKKLLCVINLWLATAAAGLAILGWLHLLDPGVILVCVFLIGVGFTFNAPAWISIVPQIVSDAELPAAVTLSGLQLYISGIMDC